VQFSEDDPPQFTETEEIALKIIFSFSSKVWLNCRSRVAKKVIVSKFICTIAFSQTPLRDYLQVQQTPYPLAQDPALLPPLLEHSFEV
jgi:hypothetical protein